MGRGAHSRLGPHALPRCDRGPRRDGPEPAGGRDLRVGAAQRGGRVAAGSTRRRRHVIHVAGGGVGTWQRNGWPVTQAETSVTGVTRVELPGGEIVGIRAANPGPFTLSGTNSWIVGRDPAWLVDPGPALDEHLARVDRRDRASRRPGRDRPDPRPRRPCRGGAGGARAVRGARRWRPLAATSTCCSPTGAGWGRSKRSRPRATRPTTSHTSSATWR